MAALLAEADGWLAEARGETLTAEVEAAGGSRDTSAYHLLVGRLAAVQRALLLAEAAAQGHGGGVVLPLP